jgi:hypothetical protein
MPEINTPFNARRRAAEEKAAKLEHDVLRQAARFEREREKNAAKITRLEQELAELQRSYLLAGAGKKLDLRELDGFGPIAADVIAARRTGMNYDRLYTLWQAVADAPDGPAIEIGTYKGGSAKLIGEAYKARGTTPRLYVADTFTGNTGLDPEVDNEDRDDGRWGEATPEDTADYLAGYPDVEVLVGDIAETSAPLDATTFGLVHADVNVYPATKFCLQFFAPRLAPGAVMILDDYGTVTCPGVKQAADEFVAAHPEFRVWHLLSSQGLLWRAA